MKAKIARHNKKILKNADKAKRPKPTCNCRSKPECPIPGECNQSGVVYQATVKNDIGHEKTYVGLASNFKNRFYKHKASMETQTPENSTTLSAYFWSELEAGRAPSVKWKILESNIPTYNPVTSKCQLCIREKYQIAFNPRSATLNSRHEIFAHCRHQKNKLLKPPD